MAILNQSKSGRWANFQMAVEKRVLRVWGCPWSMTDNPAGPIYTSNMKDFYDNKFQDYGRANSSSKKKDKQKSLVLSVVVFRSKATLPGMEGAGLNGGGVVSDRREGVGLEPT